ncbi:MAG: hypothetical protein V4667_07640 [Bacteroidota bacterium]
MKNLVLLIAFVLVANIVTAQDTLTDKKDVQLKYGIGAGAGFATGYGLSFRYVPKKFGAQVNFAPFKNKETERYSFGVTFLYTVIENRLTNLFIYQANHYYYNSQMVYVYNETKPDVTLQELQTEQYVNNGVGFGIEIIMAKRIGLNLMAGYAFYKNFKQLNITGEAALYYKF